MIVVAQGLSEVVILLCNTPGICVFCQLLYAKGYDGGVQRSGSECVFHCINSQCTRFTA